MHISRSLGRSSSTRDVGFHSRTIALIIVALIGNWGCGTGGGQPGNNNPPPPTPAITTISPKSIAAGGAAFMLSIDGTNFVAGSMVNFGGSAAATTFVNSTELTAAIPASSIASAGTEAVTVTNPAPDAGTSNPINFTVTSGGAASAPTISAFFPSCVPAGEQLVDSTDNQLEVSGNNFVPSSVVQWNGINLPTTLDPNSQGKVLIAQIPASDIASAGTAQVTVFNPPPGGGTSNSMPFTITPGGVDPVTIALDPAGKLAYVANAGCNGGVGYVSMYTIDATTGALTSIGPPVTTEDFSAESVTVDPSGKFVYLANGGDDFSSDGSAVWYTINATTGALTFTQEISGNCPGLCVPLTVAVDPSGKFAYVPNGVGGSTSVASYTINATTGALASTGTVDAPGYAVSVAVDPTGKFAYVETAGGTPGSPSNVGMFTIDATTGALTSIGAIAAGTQFAEPAPTSIIVDPAGKFVYVTNTGSADVSMYTINATTGALSSIGTVAAGTGPDSVAVDPAGKFAYVTSFHSNDISMYSIDATTGALTPIGTTATEQFPTSIAIHPSGKFAYVTNSGSNDISMYSVDSSTGALTLIGTIGT